MTNLNKRHRAKKRKKKITLRTVVVSVLAVICFAAGYYFKVLYSEVSHEHLKGFEAPEYAGQPYVVINNNVPFFDASDMTGEAFEKYSPLDSLGRCGMAYANVCREMMPTQERGEIGMIKPSGWKQAKYEGIVASNPPYLYNRCHLIAYCLSGENDNEENLITGTRYMNVEGMLPFEEKVARYLSKNDNHVLYRITPVFEGGNLVAGGVLMEAYSVEDDGAGICFCVYCFNVQPGIEIDYATGDSRKIFQESDY